MDNSTIDRRLLNILNNFNYYGTKIEYETKLINEIGLDSITVVELVTIIEKEFGIKIQNEEINKKNFSTVSSLIKFIKSKIDGA